ncbi:MAG: DUF1492 domain-containing protein [Erysipelotrichaceae bacterium]|nr:DUF1492 domain-containing protein [Erysipelotrichaceae bacterium]
MEEIKQLLETYKDLVETHMSLTAELETIKSPQYDMLVKNACKINYDQKINNIIIDIEYVETSMSQIENIVNILDPSIYKTILTMKYINLMSIDEISYSLNKSTTTIKTYTNKAIDMLYQKMKNQNISLPK